MIKKLITLLIIGFIFPFLESHACMCSTSNISFQYQTSDFVGIVKITKNHKNDPADNMYYIAEVEIIKTYKGKPLKQIYVMGNNGVEGYNSCGTFIEEGETRLIFGKTISDNKISTYLCSSHHEPNRDYYKRDFIEEKLNILARHAKNHTVRIVHDADITVYKFKKLDKPNGFKNFSIVSVKISSDGEVKKIRYLTNDKDIIKTSFEEYIGSVFFKNKLLQSIRKRNTGEFTLFFEFNPFKHK